MIPRILLFVLLVLPAPAWAGPASDMVAFFYAAPGVEFDPTNRERFTDPAKSVLDANDRAELCIDFVPSIDAQDLDEAELKRTLLLEEEVVADDATVKARFNLFAGHTDASRLVVWSLKREQGLWKVADIKSDTTGWTLGEFECAGE